MDSSVSPKDEIWFLHMFHRISNAVYQQYVRLTFHEMSVYFLDSDVQF